MNSDAVNNLVCHAIGIMAVALCCACSARQTVGNSAPVPTTSHHGSSVEATRSMDRSSPARSKDDRQQLRGIIKADFKSADMPAKWLRPGIDAEVMTIDYDYKDSWVEAVNDMLSVYPPALVRESVDAVYVLKAIRLRDVPAAGVCTDRRVYLATAGSKSGPSRTAREVASTLHHEMSSALLNLKPSCLDFAKWESVNPPGFEYSGWSGVSSQAVVTATDELKEQGFFRAYSQSARVNDFNVIAQHLMSGSEELWNDAERYPRISQKMAMTIEAYQCFDPVFTRQYFLDRREATHNAK